jgi:hypothetical protein
MKRIIKELASLRMIAWLAVTLICLGLASVGMALTFGDMGFVARVVSHLCTAVWKLGLTSSGAYIGYVVDITALPYARPDMFLMEPWKPGELPIVAPGEAIPFAASMLRRAIIMGSFAVCMTLGA